MFTRRQFVKACAVTGAGLAAFSRWVWPFSQSPLGISKFTQPLPMLGADIPVATRGALWNGGWLYDLEVAQYQHQFHPALGASTCWGYADNGGVHGYLAGAIIVNRGEPVWLKVTNKLPATHPLPVDTTVMGADLPANRCCSHLHGGMVDWTSDGGPFAWYAPNSTGPANGGESFLNGTGVPGQALHYYPNNQSARFLWFHDHAVGITRLNAYAGIAAGYIIRDHAESELLKRGYLPANEIPLVIQDKSFVSEQAIQQGYTWGNVGDLWYPWQYDYSDTDDRWMYGPLQFPSANWTTPLPSPSIVPEFFGDTIIVNGAAYPYVPVQPRHYRFRVLNGTQARFLNLQLYYEDPNNPGEPDFLAPNPPKFIQIGNECGFVPFPVALNNPPQRIGFNAAGQANRYTLLLAPAERADVIIDFSQVTPGRNLILYNDAPAPFPVGDARNDYYTGAPDQSPEGGAPTPLLGYGPNTRTLLQFRVGVLVGAPDPASMGALESAALSGPPLSGAAKTAVNLLVSSINANLDPSKAVKTRDLSLDEYYDSYGRLQASLGTTMQTGTDPDGGSLYGMEYMDPPTEVVKNGTTEIWRVYNLTADTHPMHFHLANVQVLSRQGFLKAEQGGVLTPILQGLPQQPDANEKGYKETIRMNAGEVTTLLMKFAVPWTPFPIPVSPRTGDYEYVWHCHILEHEEHEEHDMMRPLIVQP